MFIIQPFSVGVFGFGGSVSSPATAGLGHAASHHSDNRSQHRQERPGQASGLSYRSNRLSHGYWLSSRQRLIDGDRLALLGKATNVADARSV
jgi:hypothetical protein